MERWQSKSQPQPTWIESLVNFGNVVFEIHEWADKQDRQKLKRAVLSFLAKFVPKWPLVMLLAILRTSFGDEIIITNVPLGPLGVVDTTCGATT